MQSVIDVYKAYEEHKKSWSCWLFGDVVETWFDEMGYLCIRYEDGCWWHYALNESNELIWW